MSEYVCAPIEGVEPIFVEAMLRQAMAARFKQMVPDLSDEEAVNAATATWETDWDSDPEPRTFETAREAVDSELEHWTDD